MWISRSEYDQMVYKIETARQRDGRNGCKIAELERKVAILTDELNAYKRKEKEKMFEISFGLKYGKNIKYFVNAETSEEARKIALDSFLRDNKSFAESDICITLIHEHI